MCLSRGGVIYISWGEHNVQGGSFIIDVISRDVHVLSGIAHCTSKQ